MPSGRQRGKNLRSTRRGLNARKIERVVEIEHAPVLGGKSVCLADFVVKQGIFSVERVPMPDIPFAVGHIQIFQPRRLELAS